jgi:hypothetical protein
MRLGCLLRPDRLDAIPVPLQLAVASLIHVDLGGAAQRGQSHHYASHLEIGNADWPSINVLDQRERVLARATIGLRQLQRLLEKPMRPFRAIGPDGVRKACPQPAFDPFLEGCDAQVPPLMPSS